MTGGTSSFPTWAWLLLGVAAPLLALISWVVERLFHFASDGLSSGAGAVGVLLSRLPKMLQGVATAVGPWLSSFVSWLVSGITGVVAGVVSFVFPGIKSFDGLANVELASRLTGKPMSEIQKEIADKAEALVNECKASITPPPTEEGLRYLKRKFSMNVGEAVVKEAIKGQSGMSDGAMKEMFESRARQNQAAYEAFDRELRVEEKNRLDSDPLVGEREACRRPKWE